MDRNIIECHFTGDKVIHMTAPSGLEIYVCEMPGFSSVNAAFATKYGSVNNCFRTSVDEDFVTVPAGIAHYLEHKLFENEDCHAFEKYAQVGAAGNAFTGFDVTAYTIGCTRNWQPALKILIDLVQDPYFTEENVAKEQGIIAQEIKMTGDIPSRRSFFTLLKAMYKNNPVRIDQAGTIESIAEITPELLYKCYNAFYHPANSVIVIAGNVTADEVERVCLENLRPAGSKYLESFFPEEPDTVCESLVRETLPVGNTFFNLGFKCTPCSGRERLRKNITGGIICDLIASGSSAFYEELLNSGLVNSSLSGEVFCGNGYFSVIFSGESEQPEMLSSLIINEMKRWKSEGIDTDLFMRLKKMSYGDMIRILNDVGRVSSMLLSSAIDGVSPYEGMDILSGLTEEDVLELVEEMTAPERSTLAIAEGGMSNDNC